MVCGCDFYVCCISLWTLIYSCYYLCREFDISLNCIRAYAFMRLYLYRLWFCDWLCFRYYFPRPGFGFPFTFINFVIVLLGLAILLSFDVCFLLRGLGLLKC